jgi:Ca2+-binding EF-hand superfamily protein
MRPISAQTRNEQMMSEKATRQLAVVKDPVERLRLLCLQRGAAGIIGLGKVFRRMDDNQSGDLTVDEFTNGIKDSGLPLEEDEMVELFGLFDKDGSGSVNYNEFIQAIRPPMSNNRIKLIELAFNKLDASGDGQVTIEDLQKKYNVRSHPEYQNGTKTEGELLQTFLAKFEQNGSVDGVLTKEEFIDYYSGVSASIDEDMYFDLMMRQAWKL